ncbi:MAG: LpqB family beta-propeller domain-containing protein [Gemmataceae bacterium]
MGHRLAGLVITTLIVATARGDEPPRATRLTTDGSFKQHLQWSPDGKQFLVTRILDGAMALWLYDADGSNPRRLLPNTATPHFDGHFSPDGKRIAYVLDVPQGTDGKFQINVCAADGSGDRVLIPHKAFEECPRWSPDGASLAFVSTRDGNPEIYIATADGKTVRRLTNEVATDTSPSWSPDGKTLAFVSGRSGHFEVHAMNADGSGVRRITSAKCLHARPIYSPDGKRIAFSSRRDGNAEIYVADADGSNPRNLTRHPKQDTDPCWSPDGKRIAFVSTRDGGHDIYVADLN